MTAERPSGPERRGRRPPPFRTGAEAAPRSAGARGGSPPGGSGGWPVSYP